MPTGWLWLEGPQRTRAPWAQRFFVLDEGYLRYFNTDEDLDPVATINVRGVEATGVGKPRVGKHAFRLNVTRQEDGRYKYVIAGETEAESRKWLTWLCEEGVSVNMSAIKLTAKPDSEGRRGSLKSLLSFKSTSKIDVVQKGSEVRTKSFLPFGRKASLSQPATLEPVVVEDVPSSSTSKGGSLEGDDDFDDDPSVIQAPRLSAAAIGVALPSERTLLIPESSLEALVRAGSVDGEQSFAEYLGEMTRQGFVSSLPSSPVNRKDRHPTFGPTAEDVDSGNDADEFDDVDDQPQDALGSEGTVRDGVVYTSTGGPMLGSAGADPPEETARLASFSSFSLGADSAPSLQNVEAGEIPSPAYGSNVSPRQPIEPPKRPSFTERIAEGLSGLTSSISAAFVASPTDHDLTAEELAQKVAARVMQVAIRLAEGEESAQEEPLEAPPKRPSLLERLAGAFTKEASPAQTLATPPAPKKAYVDSAEDLHVRAWIKQCLLAADDAKTLATLDDASAPLREQLRSGVVLCAVLNALKPGAVGRVKTPAVTASRFAKLEPLNTYKRACSAAGLSDADCLEPSAWLDGGEDMGPLTLHIEALCRLHVQAPKFDAPRGRPHGRKPLNGVMPHHSARDVMKAKGGAHSGSQTRSVASAGAKAWRGAESNASAARAVFSLENGAAPSGAPSAEAKEDNVRKTAKVNTVRSATGATHSFAESETVAFSEYINETLGDDATLAHLLPLQVGSMALFDVLKDGVVLCKLINVAQAETIDMRCVHTGAAKPLSVYEVVENLNMAINAAVAIGCRVVNIGHDDVMSGSPHLVLGLLWQIVKAGIMAKINLKASPELIQLLPEVDDMEALRAFLALPPEKVLLKWLNYQVQRVAPDYKEVTNFGPALKDSRVYAHLLTAVAPKHNLSAVQGLTAAVAQTADPLAKAQLIIEAAHELGVREFKVFAGDITKGNEKLNMGFMAAIFNHLPGLTAPSQYGTFGSSLAHASAIIKESGHAVRLTKDGCALFGPALMKGTGAHWVELRVLEASGGCFMGMASPAGDCASAPGHAAGSVGLSRTGELWSNRAVAQPDCSGGFSIGDLIRIEYDANRQVLAFTTNGVLHANVAGGMHFGVGLQGGGALEVRIENSSFTAGSNLVALPVEDDGDSREERAFRIWINSLGLDTHVSDLPSQVRDGLLLLQLMEAIKPGVADWTKVTTKPKNVHAKVINCNYAVALGKSAFGFSLVGISGKDIQDGITKLVLAVTWQLMRYHVIKFLSSLSHKQLTEKDVVDWANARVGGGALPAISKLSDASISSGVFVCHLVKAVAPRSVDLSQVSEGKTAEEKKLNARLAVSCARKAGCMVFLLWEDIVECKPKMLLILFASLMQLEISDKASKRTVEDVRT